MKTISMPLDDYNKEILELTRKVDIRSYTKGAIDMANVIRDRIIHHSRESWFVNNEEATKAMEQLVKDITKEMLSRSFTTSSNIIRQEGK